ncbi:hypothetical protein BZA05DRAFT_248111 [Tricharina praecox]|uniref:uncharacterized protein n=1 Tax=Tricharina praecox TaxID=43433 RepID=UPI00221F4867|nr:uncharacterized protein BZA05DRAFT_248111 [Tricharina praecox]KAI5854716.1 hypothetical protein BZA05DRAFT_248111 [Tricharina praecox]
MSEPTPFPLPASFPPTDTLYYPATHNASTAPLLLFLPGNPGLINYYRTFLSTLHTLHPHLTILGASHAGFTPTASSTRHSASWAWTWGPGPFDLSMQVSLKRTLLSHAMSVLPACADGSPRRVLLMAHSMGAYLSLELISSLQCTPADELRIVGGIMLFPTVMHIARSPQGRAMAPFLRSKLVQAAAGWGAYAASWLPVGVVRGVVRGVTGQTREAAGVTAVLVADPSVLRQTIRLAAEEMEVIDQDRWGEEVWNAGGIGGAEAGKGGMVFVFGQGDWWVAEKTREEILEMRGNGKGGGARVVLEERGLPHGFCIHHGEVMAELCGSWLSDILGE